MYKCDYCKENECANYVGCIVCGKFNLWLGVLKRIVLIIMFIAITVVLFDIHVMFKMEREYAEAIMSMENTSQVTSINVAENTPQMTSNSAAETKVVPPKKNRG